MIFPQHLSRFLTIGLLFTSSVLVAADTEQELDDKIEKLYHNISHYSKSDTAVRLEAVSASLLGRPYILSSLGEGSSARFDQTPLYRLDGFDCDTFVTTVLALHLADRPEGFKRCLRKTRYQNGQVGFITRNHFTSLDWNPNNQKNGILKDITNTIHDEKNQPVALHAVTIIDKPAWYQNLKKESIRLLTSEPEEQKKRLLELQKRSSHLQISQAAISYLPLTALFNAEGQANEFLFAQIPSASVIEIVRPGWDLRKELGTRINVSHMGFGFRKNSILMYRQASSLENKTVDTPLVEYLKKYLKSPTIKGINIQIVLPQNPVNNCV